MSDICKHITNQKWFQAGIITVIILAAVVIGLQTDEPFVAMYGAELDLLNYIILAIFTLEVIIKIVAEGERPLRYFRDPWNIFDFMIVFFGLLELIVPADTTTLQILRLFRIFRVLRIISVIPELRLLVETLLKSIASIAYIGVFLLLLFYIFGTMAVFMFGDNDPKHFGSLPLAVLTLYRIVTLEDWTDIMYINMFGCDQYGYDDTPELCTQPYAMPVGAALFFVLFVSLGTMIVLNLFIGVILNSMEQVKAKQQLAEIIARRQQDNVSIADDIYLIHNQLQDITRQLDLISSRVEKELPHLTHLSTKNPTEKPTSPTTTV